MVMLKTVILYTCYISGKSKRSTNIQSNMFQNRHARRNRLHPFEKQKTLAAQMRPISGHGEEQNG